MHTLAKHKGAPGRMTRGAPEVRLRGSGVRRLRLQRPLDTRAGL